MISYGESVFESVQYEEHLRKAIVVLLFPVLFIGFYAT